MNNGVLRVLKLTSESTVALKQERNPTKAYELATAAHDIDSHSIQAWGASLDARYSQKFHWQGQVYATPFSKTYTLSGILWAADLSDDGEVLVAGSWDPFLANMWRLDNGSRLVTFTQYGRIKLCHKDGTVIQTIDAHDSRVGGVQYSADGQNLISFSDDSSINRIDG